MSPIFRALKRVLIGPTLETSQMSHQKLNKIRALAVFSSDALSSVAYSTEEILVVLQAVAAAYVVNIGAAIVVLLLILTTSYRQTVHAYPTGGGSYIVAKDNLGTLPSLIAASALLLDYVLTVSVSTASGAANIASLYPVLRPYQIELCIVSITFITIMNLRGMKESGTAFSIPTYAFLFSSLLLLVIGFTRYFTGNLPPAPQLSLDLPSGVPIINDITAFVILRAFAGGCSALTGVEAISDGVPAFREPADRNASITMMWMAACLGTMIIGNAFLAKLLHVLPARETVMSQTAAAVFGRGSLLHQLHQWFTMGILLLAANTSFADFPRLASFLSKDKFLPRAMASKGDRLVFQNGIIMLAVLSCILIVIFKGNTHQLMPLYAVGVFVSFTLSQSGMVKHWIDRKQSAKAVVNGVGATTTAIVAVILMITKFAHGAWIVMLVIPLEVLGLLKIKKHYELVRQELKVGDHKPISRTSTKHLVVIPIGATTSIARQAMEDLLTFTSRSVVIKPVHINIHEENDPRRAERAKEFAEWMKDINIEREAEGYEPINLDVIESPLRSILEPLDSYIRKLENEYPGYEVKIYIPEFIPRGWFARVALHGHMGRVILDHFRDRGYHISSIPKRI